MIAIDPDRSIHVSPIGRWNSGMLPEQFILSSRLTPPLLLPLVFVEWPGSLHSFNRFCHPASRHLCCCLSFLLPVPPSLRSGFFSSVPSFRATDSIPHFDRCAIIVSTLYRLLSIVRHSISIIVDCWTTVWLVGCIYDVKPLD